MLKLHEMEIVQDIKIAVDAVVFGYKENQLHVLGVQQKFGFAKDKWVLPGGFVLNNETLEQAVQRELQEESGVAINYLEQLYTFSALDRDPRMRVISSSYLALVNPQNFTLKPSTDTIDAQWFPVNELPPLEFDHNDIVAVALKRLQNKLRYEPIGFELLDETFPFSALEQLYQTILIQEIDRRNFRKKLLSFGFINETGEMYKPKSGRPAKLYQFDEQKYKALKEEGFHFEIKFV